MRKFAAISLAGIMAFGALPVMAEETSTEEASTEAATEAGSEAAELGAICRECNFTCSSL